MKLFLRKVNMKRVVLGMSGGVDSSVAAHLLKEKGYEVIGIFMKNWEETDENGFCTAEKDYEDVVKVAEKLDIKYYSVNFAKEYDEKVFQYFLSEYRKGRTPNPDVLCNKEIKFKIFLDYAMSLGADYIATGHYARITHDENGISKLYKGIDENKDQTYFLCQLNQNQLRNVLFPLGDYKKEEIREIANQLNLATANKKDSTGICFIGERNFDEFLDKYIDSKTGNVVDEKGNILGKHKGLIHYTIGQRRGIGIGNTTGSSGEAFYVVGKNMDKNELIVTQGDTSALYYKGLVANNVNFINNIEEKEFRCKAKFRYRQQDVACLVKKYDDKIEVIFDEPQKAITEGQFVVLYDGEECLGGAEIIAGIK